MKTMTTMFIFVLVASAAIAGGTPDGILSLTPVEQASFIAVRVELADSLMIGGVRWFNNDGSSVYPSILLAAADEDHEPDLTTTLELGGNVTGTHMGWTELAAAAPVINDVGELFTVFQLPPYAATSEPGTGPGIGYSLEAGAPVSVYLSTDGTSWTPVGGGVVPEYDTVPATAKSGAGGILFQRPEVPVFTTSLDRPRPNPFNPKTVLSFTLAESGKVELSVFNARGQRVASLVQGCLDAGPHEVDWLGRTDEGAQLASGVYFARLVAPEKVLHRRLVLLK